MFEVLESITDRKRVILAVYQVLSELSQGVGSSPRPWSAGLPESPEAASLATRLLEEIRAESPASGGLSSAEVRRATRQLIEALTRNVAPARPIDSAALLAGLRAEFPFPDLGDVTPVASSPSRAETGHSVEAPLGSSPAWAKTIELATRLAETPVALLIAGEPGTGKEHLARFIHQTSGRAGVFALFRASGIPSDLAESALFGHARGAFTGAVQHRAGLFEQADRGTLLIAEVASLSATAQAKILRIIEEGEVTRLGETASQKVDVRIVATTTADLPRAIAEGRFREDLFYRFHATLHVPPLRERREDIRVLAERFLDTFAGEQRRRELSPEATQWLLDYDWPGNVRELMNVIERATILSTGTVGVEHLHSSPPHRSRDAGTRLAGHYTAPPPVFSIWDQFEQEKVARDKIEQALRLTRFNRARAAKLLGLSRSQLDRWMQTYGIEKRGGG